MTSCRFLGHVYLQSDSSTRSPHKLNRRQEGAGEHHVAGLAWVDPVPGQRRRVVGRQHGVEGGLRVHEQRAVLVGQVGGRSRRTRPCGPAWRRRGSARCRTASSGDVLDRRPRPGDQGVQRPRVLVGQDTAISGWRGESNCRQTSLVPTMTETQSGFRSSTSVCQRASQVADGVAARPHVDDADSEFRVGRAEQGVHEADVAPAQGVKQPFADGLRPARSP